MTQIEIIFLGTTAGIPTKQRNHSSVFLRYRSQEEWTCLFDCGEGTQRQIFASGDINFMRIDNIFISHWHADHFAGLPGLVQSMGLEKRKRPLYVWAPESRKFMSLIAQLGYFTKPFQVLAKDVEFEGNQIQTLIDEKEFQILAVPTKHGIPSNAFAFVEKDRIKVDKEKAKELGLPEKGPLYARLKEKGEVMFRGKKIRLEDLALIEKGKKVVYSGDTMPVKSIEQLAENADVLIHDSTFFEKGKYDTHHSIADDVLKIAERAKVKKLILTHFSRRYQDIKELEEKIKDHPNVILARDFMKFVV